MPLSAPIRDDHFFDRLASHEVMIGQGDALDVDLRYFQDFDDALGVYVNDPLTFEVIKVHGVIRRPRQQQLIK